MSRSTAADGKCHLRGGPGPDTRSSHNIPAPLAEWKKKAAVAAMFAAVGTDILGLDGVIDKCFK